MEKAEPDPSRRSTMEGLKATDESSGKENLARYEKIYFIFTLWMVRQKTGFLLSW